MIVVRNLSGPISYNPRQRYLSGPAYNPRARYLYGLRGLGIPGGYFGPDAQLYPDGPFVPWENSQIPLPPVPGDTTVPVISSVPYGPPAPVPIVQTAATVPPAQPVYTAAPSMSPVPLGPPDAALTPVSSTGTAAASALTPSSFLTTAQGWLTQQTLISGVKNGYVVIGAVGVVLLIAGRKKGRRR